MARAPYTPKPIGNRKTRLVILVGGVVIFIAVSVVTYNRITMEERLAVQPATIPPVKAETQPETPSFTKEGELTFIAKNGNVISLIDLEIADTDESRERGLMFRKEMAETQGMIFIFPDEDYRSFWMKNTILPLDMIFVNAKDDIITIIPNTKPFDEAISSSTAPAMYVVEVNAGYTQKYHIVVGNKIRWSRL